MRGLRVPSLPRWLDAATEQAHHAGAVLPALRAAVGDVREAGGNRLKVADSHLTWQCRAVCYAVLSLVLP